jgi:branched-chain amino acid transport system permease protein
MANVKRFGLGGDAALMVLAIASFWLSPYYAFVFTSVLITALTCISIGITTERAGIISLCQVAISGVGAWVTMWFGLHYPQVPVVITLLLGALLSALVGLLLILPTLRVRGINLAIITLAFALTINIVLTRVGFPGMLSGFNYELPGWLYDEQHLLLFVIAVTLVVSRLIIWIEQIPFGAAWFTIRFSERAAAALGINVSLTKVSAFMVGAFVAGLAGGLLVLQLGSVTARNFEPYASLVIFALAILAHARFLSGALIAGALTWFTPQLLSSLGLGEWKDIADLIFAIGAIYALTKHKQNRIPKTLAAGTRVDAPAHSPRVMEKYSDSAGLAIENLSLSYGAVKALDNVSFSLTPGVVTGLVGPNGAGKSSLVDVISGFSPIKQGHIRMANQSFNPLPAFQRARNGLRRTFQQGRAVPELTIRQYVHLAAGPAYQAAALDDLLYTLGCPAADTAISHVDVGTRRLVEIAGALMSRPKILLLDEPAAGMSSLESERLGRVIGMLPELFGCTVLLVEHDMALIRSVCSELIVLEFGKVIACGGVEETLQNPDVVQAYLGVA